MPIIRTLTGITFANFKSGVDLSYAINDTFVAGQPIAFCCTLNAITTLLGLSLNTGNISNYNAYIRLTSQSDTQDILFSEVIPLSSSNIQNNSIIISLINLINEYNHDTLVDMMNDAELEFITKTFKLIVRIYSGSLTNPNTVLAQDFQQDIFFVLNTNNNGKYDVAFEELNILNPAEFTQTEINSEFNKNPALVGGEFIRIFYPLNYPETRLNSCPILIGVFGAGQLTEDYDYILSTFASYGYIAIATRHPLSAELPLLIGEDVDVLPTYLSTGDSNPQYYTYSAITILKIIDHLYRNRSKIKNNFLKIGNFNKLNFFGHSRGGAIAGSIAMFCKRKTGVFSPIKDLYMTENDIKSLILFAPMFSPQIGIDGRIVPVNLLGSQDLFPSLSETDYNYYDRKLNHPVIFVKVHPDEDVGSPDVPWMYHVGFDHLTKTNVQDLHFIQIFDAHHDYMGLSRSFSDNYPRGLFSYPKKAKSIHTRKSFNSVDVCLNILKNNLLYSLNYYNFDNEKLIKLRYIQKNQSIKNNIIASKQLYNSFKIKNEHILNYIHDFSSLEYKIYGSTIPSGITFPTISGYTIGYMLDNLNTATALTELGALFLNKTREGEVFPDDLALSYRTSRNAFAGIVNGTYKGIYFPIENNFSFGYTFSQNLSFSQNNYFCIKGSLNFENPYNLSPPNARLYPDGNTLDANFTVSLIDQSNNSASLTSKMYSDGFIANQKLCPIETDGVVLTNELTTNYYNIFCSPIMCNIFFRAGDFYLKNPNINLNQINQIRFDFGPDHGSTYAHLCIDEIFIMKNL